MGKVKEWFMNEEQERLDFAEKERRHELQQKVNGCSSETVLSKKHFNGHTIETHWNPLIKEIVVVENWFVREGYNDVSYEFEVIRSIDNVGDLIAYARS